MMPILVIGLHTVREYVRDKLFVNLLLFGLLLLGCSIALPQLTVGETHRVVLDIGLASINLFGSLIAIFLGVTLVGRDVERRTAYLLITRPIARSVVVLGKYLGLCLTLLLNMSAMVAGLCAVLWLMQVPLTIALFQSLSTMYLEFMVMTAVALLCSTFTTVTLGAILTLALFVSGHGITNLRLLAEKMGGVVDAVLTAVTYLLPNLESFNLKGHALYQQAMSSSDLALLVGYALSYSACLLGLSICIFQRRDLQ